MKSIKKITTKVWLLVACLLMLTSCYDFIFVKQQQDVKPGKYVIPEVCVYVNDIQDKVIPYVGLMLPMDFTMEDAFIFYHQTTDRKTKAGLIEYSKLLSLQMMNMEPPPTGYFWWVGKSTTFISEPGAYVAYPVLKSSTTLGDYHIDYMIGDNINGLNFRRYNDNLISVKNSKTPTNLKAGKDEEANYLTWNPSIQNGYLKGYNIYCNGIKLNDHFVVQPHYLDEYPKAGVNLYEVRAYYMKFGETDPSHAVKVCNCPTGPAVTFDGMDDQLIVFDHASLNLLTRFTAETWIYLEPNCTDGKYSIISKGLDGKGFEIYAKGSGEELIIGVDLANVGLTSKYPVKASEWHHVATTWDGTTLKLFIDGQAVNKCKAFTLLDNTKTPLFVGRNGLTDADALSGKVDNIRLWNIARTDEEISEFRTLLLSGNEAGLIGYWRFDDGCNHMACDLSQYGNNGYLMGSCWCGSNFPFIPDTKVTEGAVFSLPVKYTLQETPNLMELEVEYNTDIFEYKNISTWNTAFEKWEIKVMSFSPGVLSIRVTNTGLPVFEKEDLFKIVFKAKHVPAVDVIQLNSVINDGMSMRTRSGIINVGIPGSQHWPDQKAAIADQHENKSYVYPNPAQNFASFNYTLSEDCMVKIAVYNIAGQEVLNLLNQNQVAGEYSIEANISGFEPGVYIYTVARGSNLESGKLIVNK